LELHSPTGGATLAHEPNATVSYIKIAASDDPYGVFSLLSNQHVSVNEGANVSLVVTRKGGDIGFVEIKYQIYGDNRNDIIPDNGGKVYLLNLLNNRSP